MVCSASSTRSDFIDQLTQNSLGRFNFMVLGVSMAKILVTGFEPFDSFTINPSEEIVKDLNGIMVSRHSIVGIVLPLDYKNALGILDEALEKHKPEYVVCLGQSNRASITIERIAINILSTKRPDNYGNIPESDIINYEGPAAYLANLEPQRLVQVLKDKGIPAEVSYFAGAYGCNWLLYNVMHRIETGVLDAEATFIHLPHLPGQVIEKDLMFIATMTLDDQF
ncbi:MAG: hypothetical protein E4H14_19045, partial [Candidatus Thorarchaeota archaeon]